MNNVDVNSVFKEKPHEKTIKVSYTKIDQERPKKNIFLPNLKIK